MKKTLATFIITALILVTFVTKVQALSFGIKITPTSSEVKKGDSVTLVLSVSNLDVGSNGINTLITTIDYDKSVFETLTTSDIKSLNNWDSPTFNPSNGKVILTKGDFVNSESDVFQVNLTAKSTATIGETTVTFKSIQASNSVEDINATDTTYILKVVDSKSDNGNSGETVVKPSVNVKYDTVANGIKVTLESSSELQALAGWTLSVDKKTLTKVYTESFKGTVIVKDVAGNSSDAINIDVKIGSSSDNNNNNNNNSNSNKDTTKPTASIKYTKNTNGVTVTITANKEIKPVTGWTLSTDKKTLTKLFKENYTGTLTIEDLSGNKSEALSIKVDTSLPNGGTDTNNNNGNNGSNSPSSLPKAGAAYIIPVIALVAVVGTVAFIRYKSMEY